MSATTSPCCTGFHLLYIYIYPQVIFILVNVKMNMFISVHRARVLYYTHTDYICCMSTSAWFFFYCTFKDRSGHCCPNNRLEMIIVNVEINMFIAVQRV